MSVHGILFHHPIVRMATIRDYYSSEHHPIKAINFAPTLIFLIDCFSGDPLSHSYTGVPLHEEETRNISGISGFMIYIPSNLPRILLI